MNIQVKLSDPKDNDKWDQYVSSHSQGSVYHLTGWKKVIGKTYGHKAYYSQAMDLSNSEKNGNKEGIVGVLPLIQLRHFFFGNRLVSMPYVDSAGILASSQEAEELLLNKAIQTLEQCEGTTLELRQVQPLSPTRHFVKPCAAGKFSSSEENSVRPQFTVQTDSRKARMGLFLPGSSNELFLSLKSKLRSQVRKPLKEGLYARIGGAELLDDFFSVLSVNMRDLGSPVHSKKFFRHVLSTFEDRSNIVLVFKGNQPLACSLVLGYRNVLNNPWASALKEYNFLSPNMLLYWTMLEYACDQGYEFFDFGRSTPDEGTYKFKQQWGAAPRPLYWYYVGRQEGQAGEQSQRIRLRLAVRYWNKLHVTMTRVCRTMLRKHIGL